MADLDPVSANRATEEQLVVDGFNSGISERPDVKTGPMEVVLSSVPGDSAVTKTAPGDPLIRAEKYLSKHNIVELFQHMTSDVAYRRPHDVIDHMIDYITRLQEEAMVRRGVILTSSSSHNS